MKSLLLALSAASVIAAAPSAFPSVVQRIPLHDGGWDILTVDPVTHRVFISRSDGVDAVNTLGGSVTPHLISGTRFHGVTVVPGSDLAVATEAAGSAIVFNRVTGVVTAEVKTDPDADATVYEPKTRTVWVMNGDSGTISIVDPAAGTVVDKINLGSALEFAAIDGHGHLFVNLSDKGRARRGRYREADCNAVRDSRRMSASHGTGLRGSGRSHLCLRQRRRQIDPR